MKNINSITKVSSQKAPINGVAIVYLVLSAIWFVVSALLIIHTTYVEDMSSMFHGVGSVILVIFFIVLGIPLLIIYIYNITKSLGNYNPSSENNKTILIFSSITPVVYYCFFAHFVISRLQYIIFYGITLLIAMYVFFFLILFSYVICVLFDSTRNWMKSFRKKMNIFIFIFLFMGTIIISLIPITHSNEIFDSRVKILLEQHENEYQNSICTYTYVDSHEDDRVRIDTTIQFLSYAQSSYEFEASQNKNNMTPELYITKKSVFSTNDIKYINNYINDITSDNIRNGSYFAQHFSYSYDIEQCDGEVVSVTEYWSAWIYGDHPFYLDERFTSIYDVVNINKKGLIEKQEQGSHIKFDAETFRY